MRRSLFWFGLMVLMVAVAACGLDRRMSGPGAEEAVASATPEAPVPAPTFSGPASTRTPTPEADQGGITLPEIKLPEVDVPAGAVATAQAALQAAGTAVQQAGDAAGTAAEQGGAALATVRTIPTPDLSGLTERLAAAKPDVNGDLSVTLNASELNQLLRLRYQVMSSQPELRDAAVRFEAGLIVLSGNVPLPLPVDVRLSLRPVVVDGQSELAIVDAAVGRLEAPEIVLGFASNLVSSALSEAIRRLPEGFQLQAITVDEGLLTISGRVNN
ncbi:MAG: hypothetical protein PVH65_05890 [Chloroflexota bacterium]